MDSPGPDTNTHLTYANVGLGLTFILFNAFISFVFGLGVESSLVTAAVRCIIQLALVATFLQKVFDADNLWAVAGIAGKPG
jgi:ABC-type iron transport system FetAB permease component